MLRVKIRYLKLSLAMGLALASSQVMALGLGQLQVKSGLNQPLVAEIPIFAAMPGEIDSLSVRLASPEAFERVGLTRPSYLTANLSFSIGKNVRGQSVVLVTSSGKFVEPFLSFLIEADWGRGSVTKEYTALIDPPYIAKAIVRPMEAPVVAVAPIQYVPPPEPTLPPIVLKPESEPTPVVAEQTAPAPLVFEPVPDAPVALEPEPVVAAAELAPTYFPPVPAPEPIVQAPAPPSDPSNTSAYGPVSTGKTLWSIAEEVRPDASVTIKQMMVALLRANPEAFQDDNVNKLKRGSVLRIPGRDEASILTNEQAAALVAEQSTNLRAQRQPVPQPSETAADNSTAGPIIPESAEAAQPVVTKPKPKPVIAKISKPKARLEIVPPSGKTSAKAVQSGAAAAGGTELRAELTQAREDIAVRDSEISELKSRLTDLEGQQTDTQKLIEMKDSQLKALQDKLGKTEVAAPTATPALVAAKTDSTAIADVPVTSDPWYMDPMVHYGAGSLLLLGGLVWFLRRSKNKPEEDESVVSRRISDDADLQASLSSLQDAKNIHNDKTAGPGKAVKVDNNTQVRAVVEKARPTPAVIPLEDPELVSLRSVVRSKPQDLEVHLALLRYHYARGESKDFESAAQIMRTHVSSAQDPRWREAVVMGVTLLPGHALFNQEGWNSPKFESLAKEVPVPAAATVVVAPQAPVIAKVEAESALMSQQDMEDLDILEAVSIVGEPAVHMNALPIAALPNEIMLTSESDFIMLDNMPDIHRSESELMDIDAASSTKIELARAYLEIGDVEGAHFMLEEVIASGSAPAKAMAKRIIGELG